MKKLILILFVLFANIKSFATQEISSNIISNQGFTLNSFLRGLLGMFVLILIAYLLSANKKAINAKIKLFESEGHLIHEVSSAKVAKEITSFCEGI